MTQLLASPANPDGWSLEDILEVLRGDLMLRSARMVDDPRPEVRGLVANNVEIMDHLTSALHRAQESSRILGKLGVYAYGRPR